MIEVQNIKKYFKKPIRGKGIWGMFKSLFSNKHIIVKAVDDISFTINDGEAVGYIGANGAGKSTTIKMMSGILTPSEGDIYIDGRRPYISKERNKVLSTIGVVFGQKTQLWYDLPVTETFDLLKHIYEVPDDQFRERMALLTDILGLKGFIDAPVRTLSLGQRMRADIAAAMLHNPKTLFLDEPTIGLDVLVKRNLINAIKEIRNQYNTTLILTTHAMSDIELLCERVIILDEGKILYDGSLNDIKHKFGDKRNVSIITANKVDRDAIFSEFPNGLISIDCDKENETYTTFTVDAQILHINYLLDYLLKNYSIEDIKITETSIEKVVEQIYESKQV